jgi:hypothetical protein
VTQSPCLVSHTQQLAGWLEGLGITDPASRGSEGGKSPLQSLL